jgi:diphthine-ammonia ligase
MRVAVNWSGGKDCCLACYYAIQKGFEISTLLNFTFTNYGRYTPVWVLKYLTLDIGTSTPRKFTALLNLAFRSLERRLSRRFTILSKQPKARTRASTSSNVMGPTNQKPSRRMVPHEVAPEIVSLQARAMEVPIIQKETTWGEFDNHLKRTLGKIDRKDVEGGIVWGMLPPDPVLDHPRKIKKATGLRMGRGWITKQLRDLGIKALFPLVEKTPEEVFTDLIGNNFEVIVIVVNPKFIGEEWLGRTIDQDFIELMRKLNRERGVPILGDEYHTFVLDCPLFKKRIKILESKKMSKDGYSVLEISKAQLASKT